MAIQSDLSSDLKGILAALLVSEGCNASSSDDLERLCYLYVNLRRRLVDSHPRTVQVSREFVCPVAHQAGLATVRKIIETGGNLRAHLSRGVLKRPHEDDLINDWGIHHVHLGTTYEADGFCVRTKELLFARFNETTAYFIQVLQHGDWALDQLMEIVHRNWPDTIARFRLGNGTMHLATPIAESERINLRRGGVTLLVEVDGQVYAPPGGGITTARTSMDVTRSCIEVQGRVRQFDEALRQREFDIRGYMTDKGLVPGDPLTFSLGTR